MSSDGESLPVIVTVSGQAPAIGERFVDAKDGWVYQREATGLVRVEPTQERFEEDMQQLRMDLADPRVGKKDVLRRHLWTQEYYAKLLKKLREWEGEAIRTTSTELFLSSILATLDRQNRELEQMAGDPGIPPTTRVRAREVIARNNLSAFAAAQSAGFVFKAAEKHEVSARVIKVDATPEALAAAGRTANEQLARSLAPDGFRRAALEDVKDAEVVSKTETVPVDQVPVVVVPSDS